MTKTSAAAITTAFKDDENTWLDVVKLGVDELYAIECGMVNQTPDARARQNEAWTIQNQANVEIVRAALAAGVPAGDITAITYAERH
jgi:hypothetical protein